MEIDLTKVEAALKEDRAKLERVEEAFNIIADYQRARFGTSLVTQSATVASPAPLPSSGGASKTEKVKEALSLVPERFDLNDVQAAVEAKGFDVGRQDISFILSRLAKSGHFEVVEKGSGTKPATFLQVVGRGVRVPASGALQPVQNDVLSLDELIATAPDEPEDDGLGEEDDGLGEEDDIDF